MAEEKKVIYKICRKIRSVALYQANNSYSTIAREQMTVSQRDFSSIVLYFKQINSLL
jgi:hypothetical protein